MSYCNAGDKPRVDYKFNSEAGITYQSQVSPINVVTGTAPFNTTSNYNSQGYRITFNSPQGAYGQIQLTVLDYQIFTYQGTNYLQNIPCGGSAFPAQLPENAAVITSAVTEDHTVHCPSNTPNNGTCTLAISHQGATLFKVQGNCPLTYVVTCGKCPPGTCECHSDSYPGYCCNDCGSNAAQIHEITQSLRNQNNGR